MTHENERSGYLRFGIAVGIGIAIAFDIDCDPDPDTDPEGSWIIVLFSEQSLTRLVAHPVTHEKVGGRGPAE